MKSNYSNCNKVELGLLQVFLHLFGLWMSDFFDFGVRTLHARKNAVGSLITDFGSTEHHCGKKFYPARKVRLASYCEDKTRYEASNEGYHLEKPPIFFHFTTWNSNLTPRTGFW